MEQEEVLIHGVSYNAMCQILHFIYTSELELSLSNVQETLVAACQLQVRLTSLEQGRHPSIGVVSLGACQGQAWGWVRQVRTRGSKRVWKPPGSAWFGQVWAQSRAALQVVRSRFLLCV